MYNSSSRDRSYRSRNHREYNTQPKSYQQQELPFSHTNYQQSYQPQTHDAYQSPMHGYAGNQSYNANLVSYWNQTGFYNSPYASNSNYEQNGSYGQYSGSGNVPLNQYVNEPINDTSRPNKRDRRSNESIEFDYKSRDRRAYDQNVNSRRQEKGYETLRSQVKINWPSGDQFRNWNDNPNTNKPSNHREEPSTNWSTIPEGQNSFDRVSGNWSRSDESTQKRDAEVRQNYSPSVSRQSRPESVDNFKLEVSNRRLDLKSDRNAKTDENPAEQPKSLFQKLLDISNADLPKDWDASIKTKGRSRKPRRTGRRRGGRGRKLAADGEDDFDSESAESADESEDDKMAEGKSQNNNTFYNSTVNVLKKERKPTKGDLKLELALKTMPPESMYNYLTQIFDFLQDESVKKISFGDADDHEKQFLANIKNSAKILGALDPRCQLMYRKIMLMNQQCKLSWKIRFPRVNGKSVPEYLKGLPDEAKKPILVSQEEFRLDALEKVLEYMQDDTQGSLTFDNIGEVARVKFLLSLRRLNAKKNMSDECWVIYKKIIKIVREKEGVFKWGVEYSNSKKRKLLVYIKEPQCGDVGSVRSDESDGRRSRGRGRRARGRGQGQQKETEDLGKKDGRINFMPQTQKEDGLSPPREREANKMLPPRVNKEKAKILEGLAKPVVATKAERMMMMMGWKGGALGSKGDGIVEPIAPNLLQVGNSGFGHVREASRDGRAKRRTDDAKSRQSAKAEQRHGAKADDFVVGVWQPVATHKKSVARKARRQIEKDALKTMALKSLLKFVEDDRQLEMEFDKNLKAGQRKVVHEIVCSLNDGSPPDLDSAEQYNLYGEIVSRMDCVLYTESKGENAQKTRQLFIFKTVSDDTYLITPDEFEDEIVEPAEFIGDEEMAKTADNAKNVNDVVTENQSEDDDLETVTINANAHANNEGMLRVVTQDGQIAGISILRLKYMEKRPVLQCPANSKCQEYMLCRKFLGECSHGNEGSNDSSSNESTDVPKRIRKRPYKGIDLLESKMKSVKIPRQDNGKIDNQERVIRLLVSYLNEFFDDKDATKLRFLGDFKVVDRIAINSFLNELNECIKEESVESLARIFGSDEEIFLILKRIIFEGTRTIRIERNDDGPFSTYTVHKADVVITL